MGKGGKGEGKDPASQRYVEMNRQIVHSADDKTKFSSFLDHLINEKVKLDTANEYRYDIATRGEIETQLISSSCEISRGNIE